MKFNNLTQTDLDNILVDLVDNWTSINRGGVSINLKNQTVNDPNSPNNGAQIVPSEAGFKKARILAILGDSLDEYIEDRVCIVSGKTTRRKQHLAKMY